jgi:hypothetical protein
MTALRLLVFFLVGLSVWILTFGRSAAWDARRAGWLVGIVVLDEFLGIATGMYLARSGSWFEAAACALGGAIAALFMLRRAHGVSDRE